MTWQTLTADEPGLAAACRRLLSERHGYSYLATMARDGAPRIHPVAPILVAAGLFVAVQRNSPKHRDLAREPRLALHSSVVPPDDEEIAIRGQAHAAEDAALRAALSSQASEGAALTDGMTLFRIEVTSVTWTRWLDGRPTHHVWRRSA